MTAGNDEALMARALRLAALGRYSTHPNPAVGCVLVRDGEVVGEGYHVQAGLPHAEAIALKAAGDKAKGATCFVTLEPCSFAGRTPACTEALAKAGVKRVHAAMLDPDPRNAGKGMAALEAAGIATATGLLAAEATALNPGHIKRHTQGLPHVRLKLAMSMDGRTALANGESQWITSPESRADVQFLRAEASALVTGVETIIADDPALRIREELIAPHPTAARQAQREGVAPDGQGRVPANASALPHPEATRQVQREVIVLDGRGRIPPAARILTLPGTLVAAPESVPLPKAAKRLPSAADSQGRIDLPALFKSLAARDHSQVLIECGPTLAGAAIAEGLVDELVLYIAPRFMGADALPLLHLPKIDRMPDLLNAQITQTQQLGPDLKVTLALETRKS